MKKLIVIAGLLYGLCSYSQFINVDTSISEYQLAWDKLVHTCPTGISNFSYKGADTYGLPYKSIAYFTSNGSSFPISSGVVLSTGNVMSAIGPNTSMQDNGNLAAWGGDTELDLAINNALIPLGYPTFTSTNSAYLQFDFVPIADTFSFNFLFASEDYGTNQCNFSDSFAFLLTDITAGGTAANLAVVPSTTLPISVGTIRDELYNSNCSSLNASYFASYNGGSNAASSPTNFEGQTVPMTASATIIPGHTYRIKIVIADASNYLADSAIFIDSQNFNTGTQLILPSYSFCNPSQQPGSSITITTTNPNPSDYTYSWVNDNAPTTILSTSNSLTTNQAGNYSLTYTLIGSACPYPVQHTTISYYPTITTSTVKTLYSCQSSVPYRYDLTLNNIAPTTGSYTTTYHSTAPTSATDNTNIITTPYTSATGIQTVYVRVVDNTTGCFVVRSFNLRLTSPATSSQNITLVACENQTAGVGNGTANINLATYINGTSTDNPQSLLNGLSTTLYTVSFFTSTGAPIANASNYQFTNGEIVNAVISIKGDADTDCNITRTVTLTFKPKAPLYPLSTATTIYACGSYTLPNISSLSPYQGNYFYDNTGTTPVTNLTITTDTVIYIYSPANSVYCSNYKKYTIKIVTTPTLPSDFAGTHCVPYQLPTVPYGKFYTQPNGAGTAYNSGATISSIPATNPLTLYWYYNNTTTTGNNCPIQSGPFQLTFLTTPVAQTDVIDCVSYTLPALSSGLSYHTASNGGGTILSAGTPINSTQDIYVYNGNCDDVFRVIIGNTGFPTSSTQCAGYQINLPIGILHENNASGTVLTQPYTVNATKTFYIELPTRAGANYGCITTTFTITVPTPALPTIPNQAPTCGKFLISSLPVLPTGVYYYNGSHTTGTPTQYLTTDEITNTSHTTQLVQAIYIYTQDTATGCFAESQFNVTINPLPDKSNAELPDQNIACGNSLGYQLSVLPTPPANTTFSYNSASDGTGTQYNAGDYINQNETIYVVVTETTYGCKDSTDFTITDNRVSVTVPTIGPNDINGCGTYTLTQAIVGTGIQVYDANNGINTPTMSNLIPLPHTFNSNTTVYLWDDNGNISNFCYDIEPFNIQIFTTPTVQAPPANLTGCGTFTLPTLTTGNYYYDGTHASGGTPTQITSLTYTNTTQTNITQTIWTYNPNPAHPGCFSENSFTITVYPTPVVATVNQVPSQNACDSFILPAFTGANHHYYDSTGIEIPALTTTITTLGANNFTIKNIDPTTLCESTPYAFTITINQTPNVPTQTPVYACDSYTLPSLPTGWAYYDGSHAGGGTINPIASTSITNSTTVWVYAETGTTPNCWDEEPLTINIYNVSEPSIPATVCSGYVLPTLTNGNYYTSYNAATQTASNMLTSTTLTATTSTAMTIYVWGQSGYSPNCSDVYTINVTVEPSAQAFVSNIPTPSLTFCDNDTNTTNSYTVPGLHALYDSYILGSQTGSNFNIAYYNTNTDATNQTNPITDATVNPIWVRVNNSTAPSQCSYDIKQITFIINPMPNPSLGNPVICMNANGTVQNPATITASLPSGNYTYVWTVPTGVANPGNVASFTTTVVGAYSVLVTNNTTGCPMATSAVTNVIQSIEPTITYTASEDFADSTTITVFASPIGNYLYQIDGGNYQSSPVFTNIASGHHTVVVKDLYGCNPTSPVDVYIVNYPHFFTPNGDGYNDYWNIKDLRHFGVFKIRIFDRYDKLIKEISTNTPGWDGMYNNEMLPADDYWFTIDYYKDGVNRQYKSHFALIR